MRSGLSRRRPARPAGGQATVELALALPVIVLFLMCVFQVAFVARDQVLTVHAARAAAREAAVGADDKRVRAAAHDVLGGAEVSVQRGARVGDDVVVTVRYESPTALPLIGPLFPDPQLEAKAVMRRER